MMARQGLTRSGTDGIILLKNAMFSIETCVLNVEKGNGSIDKLLTLSSSHSPIQPWL